MAELLEEHLRLLTKAVAGEMPDRIDESSGIAIQAVRTLVEAGYFSTADASTADNACFLNPRITEAGREYLTLLANTSLPTRKAEALEIPWGIVSVVLALASYLPFLLLYTRMAMGSAILMVLFIALTLMSVTSAIIAKRTLEKPVGSTLGLFLAAAPWVLGQVAGYFLGYAGF